MDSYTLQLSEETCRKLMLKTDCFRPEEYKDLKGILKYAEDKRFLENNRVNLVPIPKGFTVYPHR